MKNRLVVTISDVNKTRSYNVHQLVKKFLYLFILLVFCIIGGSFWFISFLNEEMDSYKQKKEQQIKILEEKENELKTQNSMYSLQIKDKIKDIEELSSKLDDIEEIIGIKNEDDNASLIKRVDMAKMSVGQKMHLLQVVPSGWPLKEPSRITAKYGYRTHPVTRKRQFHRGIDLKAARNTEVITTADGVARYVKSRNQGDFGRVIIIAHNNGFETVYAHLQKTLIKVGDVIKKGDVIALSGNSGRSTGPHLHYEVRQASRVYNPIDFMRWDFKNYESIFTKQRRIPWESLIEIINNQHKILEPQ